MKKQKVIEFILEFGKNVEIKVQELEEFKKLSSEEKKGRLDDFALMFITKGIDALPLNAIIKFSLKWFMKQYISIITQTMYNLLKTKIAGITK